MLSGSFPSEGRSTPLYGRVGDNSLSICGPVMTSGSTPYPKMFFSAGSMISNPVAMTTLPTCNFMGSGFILKSMQSAGQTLTHSWHWEHSAQFKQRLASKRAFSSLKANS